MSTLTKTTPKKSKYSLASYVFDDNKISKVKNNQLLVSNDSTVNKVNKKLIELYTATEKKAIEDEKAKSALLKELASDEQKTRSAQAARRAVSAASGMGSGSASSKNLVKVLEAGLSQERDYKKKMSLLDKQTRELDYNQTFASKMIEAGEILNEAKKKKKKKTSFLTGLINNFTPIKIYKDIKKDG